MVKRIIFGAVAVGLVAFAAYASFYVAPEERTMGVIQKIFYFHAATAWAGETTFFVCFLANLLYIWKRLPKYDWLGVTCAEVGAACITVVLITGPIWAHPVWGIWWTWDARLTTTLVLWLIYVSYLLLRRFAAGPQVQTLAAVAYILFVVFFARTMNWDIPATMYFVFSTMTTVGYGDVSPCKGCEHGPIPAVQAIPLFVDMAVMLVVP